MYPPPKILGKWWVLEVVGFFFPLKGGQRLDLHGPRASPGRNRWMACSNCSANGSSAMYLLRTPNKPIKDIRSITWTNQQNKTKIGALVKIVGTTGGGRKSYPEKGAGDDDDTLIFQNHEAWKTW